MILARDLKNEHFLNLSENYGYISGWVSVYDKYAKLLKGVSVGVSEAAEKKVPESENDKVDLTNKHLELQKILVEFSQKLKGSRLYSETLGLTEAHALRQKHFSGLKQNIKSKRYTGTQECQDAAAVLIDQTSNYKAANISTRSDMTASITGYLSILNLGKNSNAVTLLKIKDRMTELESSNQAYIDLDKKRGSVREERGLSASVLNKECRALLSDLYHLVNTLFTYYENDQFIPFANELNGVTESYQLLINKRKAEAKRKADEKKEMKLLPLLDEDTPVMN